jgi:spermidine synthase
VFNKRSRLYKVIILILLSFSFPLYASKENVKNKKTIVDSFLEYLYLPISYILPHYETRDVLYETESQYFFIRVEKDYLNRRHLVFLPRKGSQSIFNPQDPEEIISSLVFYSAITLPALNRKPEKILFLGMGGGIMPMMYRRSFPDIEIDIVEIDRSIPAVAEKYFGFKKDDDISIYIQDARVYVNKSKEKYDIIFMDIYDANNIPFQVTTKEYFEAVKNNLAKDGVLYINLANLKNKKFIASELRTIFSVFPKTYIFESPNRSNFNIISTVGNDLKIAAIEEKSAVIDNDKVMNFKLSPLLNSLMKQEELIEIMSKSNNILTDDYAPVN